MIMRLEIIQAGRGQYLYKKCETVQRTKGLKADKGIKSEHAFSLGTKGKIRGDNEKSLMGQQKEDH